MLSKIPETTTIEIDGETHLLIRQYCIFNNITIKDFIREIANDRLTEFKKRVEYMRKFKL